MGLGQEINFFFDVWDTVSSSSRPCALHCGKKQARPQIQSFLQPLLRKAEGGWKWPAGTWGNC